MPLTRLAASLALAWASVAAGQARLTEADLRARLRKVERQHAALIVRYNCLTTLVAMPDQALATLLARDAAGLTSFLRVASRPLGDRATAEVFLPKKRAEEGGPDLVGVVLTLQHSGREAWEPFEGRIWRQRVRPPGDAGKPIQWEGERPIAVRAYPPKIWPGEQGKIALVYRSTGLGGAPLLLEIDREDGEVGFAFELHPEYSRPPEPQPNEQSSRWSFARLWPF